MVRSIGTGCPHNPGVSVSAERYHVRGSFGVLHYFLILANPVALEARAFSDDSLFGE